eukprot:COSAG05_NODE_1889_length_3884_cov_112.293999_2_plen_31_part_00
MKPRARYDHLLRVLMLLYGFYLFLGRIRLV